MIYHTHKADNIYEARSGWFDLSDLDACVRDTVRTLRPHADSFDTIVAQGVSGLIVASPVALILKKELAVVRKDNDGSRQHRLHQGDKATVLSEKSLRKRVLFVDDCIASGRTQKRVLAKVREHGGTVAGTYTYQDDHLETGDPDHWYEDEGSW